jgi:Putative regulator of cell autolysis
LLTVIPFRVHQITQKQALENRYLDQLRSLEMRMLRVQMNPHFIFNALNSVRYFVLKEERKTASEYLSRFARLLRFILRISKMARISLAEEIDAVKNYVEFEQIRFSRRFTFHLQIAPELPLERIAIQPMLIQPFLENAIWHGLMPLSGSEGRLTLQLSQGEGQLKISIDDNGVGRSAAAAQPQKNP